jgi:hypothetical protein
MILLTSRIRDNIAKEYDSIMSDVKIQKPPFSLGSIILSSKLNYQQDYPIFNGSLGNIIQATTSEDSKEG